MRKIMRRSSRALSMILAVIMAFTMIPANATSAYAAEVSGIVSENGVAEEKRAYCRILSELSEDEVDDFLEEGKIPDLLAKFIDIDPESTNFISKRYKIPIGNINDIIDLEQNQIDNKDDE